MADPLVESKSAEAINAAAVHAEAIENARVAQIESAVEGAIAKFFNRGVDEKRFIDIGRIPFICDDLHGIHAELKAMNENSAKREDFLLLQQRADLTTKLVFGAVALILVAFVGALLVLVFK